VFFFDFSKVTLHPSACKTLISLSLKKKKKGGGNFLRYLDQAGCPKARPYHLQVNTYDLLPFFKNFGKAVGY